MNKNKGVSLIEILIVITIILALLLIYFGLRGQLNKGRDAKRKDDLERIRVAFEDYYNDNGCYPDIAILENCGSDDLDPYLKKVPCDPATNQSYKGLVGTYIEGSCYVWYKAYTFLENEDDPAISRLGLEEGETIDGEEVNYGVSSPNVAVGDVPATTFICPTTREPAPHTASCPNPYDMVGDCGVCSCFQGERIFQGPNDYYCCPDETCG